MQYPKIQWKNIMIVVGIIALLIVLPVLMDGNIVGQINDTLEEILFLDYFDGKAQNDSKIYRLAKIVVLFICMGCIVKIMVNSQNKGGK